jgi:hypothetical protein
MKILCEARMPWYTYTNKIGGNEIHEKYDAAAIVAASAHMTLQQFPWQIQDKLLNFLLPDYWDLMPYRRWWLLYEY